MEVRELESGVGTQDIRVVFLWAEVSAYMAASWRALAQRKGVHLHVVHPERLTGKVNPFLSDPHVLDGVSQTIFDSDRDDVEDWLVNELIRRRTNVVVLCGWLYKPYSRVVNRDELRGVRVIVGMDSPWRGTVSQRLARLRLSGLVSRLDTIVTSGERSSEYARRIGVPENRIRTGYYGFDFARFQPVMASRAEGPSGWPRQFLYVGRYVPQKDLATLVHAYSLYRQSVSDPWGLTCCGDGPDRDRLKDVQGVVDAGFTQPKDLPAVFRRHGAFVLASRFEPWGVVIAEAAASGLPVLCTTACGAGADVVRPYFNGLVVVPEDAAALARAMRWIHEHEQDLPRMGRRSQNFAEAYSADVWATRWHNYLNEALESAGVGVR